MARKAEGWTLQTDKRTGKRIVQFRIAGRKFRRCTGCTDPIEAKEAAAVIYAREVRKAQNPQLHTDPFLAEILDEYLEAMRDTHSTDYWNTQYDQAIRFAEYFPRVSDITDASLRRYHKKRLGEVLRTTVCHEMTPLNQCLEWAFSEGLIEHPVHIFAPHKSAKGTRRNNTEHATLTDEQAERLIATLPERTSRGNPLRDVFAFAWDTGLRAGSIWELEAGPHFRRGRDFLTLTPDIVKTREALEVPLTTRAYAILDEHAPDIGPIFTRWDYRTALKRHAEKLFGKVHLRAMRHSAITDAQRKSKGDRMAAKAHAGHKNITTTDRYTHSNLDDSRRALNARFGEYGTPTGTRESE
jgi:integrase